jgi:hypothetical protein
MLATILNFLGGSVLKSAVDAYRERLAAMGQQDKLAVELATKEIDAEIAARAEASKILILENGRWWTAAPRAIVQWSLAIYIATLLIWDKTLGWGSHDPLYGALGNWADAIILMWFGGRTIEKVARIFKR